MVGGETIILVVESRPNGARGCGEGSGTGVGWSTVDPKVGLSCLCLPLASVCVAPPQSTGRLSWFDPRDL